MQEEEERGRINWIQNQLSLGNLLEFLLTFEELFSLLEKKLHNSSCNKTLL
jgi:hypothetical protein